MSLFHRRPGPVAPPAPLVDNAVLVGTLPCSATGCPEQTGVLCAYVSRRSQACGTAWCARHAVAIDGSAYCRRHAGTVRALARSGDVKPAPDTDCRAASLVAWAAGLMNPEIVAALESVRQPGEALRPEALRLIYAGRGRQRAWEYTWKLAGHAGFTHWVAFRVDEATDDLLEVIVDSNPVSRSVPIWIVDRRNGRRLTDVEADAQRAGWCAELIALIRRELAFHA